MRTLSGSKAYSVRFLIFFISFECTFEIFLVFVLINSSPSVST